MTDANNSINRGRAPSAFNDGPSLSVSSYGTALNQSHAAAPSSAYYNTDDEDSLDGDEQYPMEDASRDGKCCLCFRIQSGVRLLATI